MRIAYYSMTITDGILDYNLVFEILNIVRICIFLHRSILCIEGFSVPEINCRNL
jgi:hypothetical protein